MASIAQWFRLSSKAESLAYVIAGADAGTNWIGGRNAGWIDHGGEGCRRAAWTAQPAALHYALLASMSCSKIRIGGFFPRMASSVITTSLICFCEGASYMTSSMTSSKIARSPRAPVFCA